MRVAGPGGLPHLLALSYKLTASTITHTLCFTVLCPAVLCRAMPRVWTMTCALPPTPQLNQTDPEGLEGWRPDDFQRPRPGGGRGQQPDIDPDIGLPGPGRGTDWDSMYG